MTTNSDKIVYLIRHGESQGQAARQNGLDRKTDPSLLDAGLTRRGQGQAKQIPYLLDHEIELVISSPLTRALHTAILGFCNNNDANHDSNAGSNASILVHYDIREIGSRIPENRPRPMNRVMKDLSFVPNIDELVDYTSLQPQQWPPTRLSAEPHGQKVQDFLVWLARERPETSIAVVCHYNVIQAALGPQTKAVNATPILCRLTRDGNLYLANELRRDEGLVNHVAETRASGSKHKKKHQKKKTR